MARWAVQGRKARLRPPDWPRGMKFRWRDRLVTWLSLHLSRRIALNMGTLLRAHIIPGIDPGAVCKVTRYAIRDPVGDSEA